jgi:7-carboxy-7-deazaguanine synthase
MAYAVKEIFYTLQGEGANAGRPAVFCRFAGCNLWSGRDADRADAVCTFCDTDFVGTDGTGGGKFVDADALADAVASHWPVDPVRGSLRSGRERRFVVCTGGEPALQLDAELVAALHARGFAIAIETNGTLPLPAGIDWVCVSPKSDATIVVTHGDELKLVYPQARALPERFADLAFEHFLIQPMDGLPGDPAARTRNTASAVEYCLSHPQWRLSMQTHKVIGIR